MADSSSSSSPPLPPSTTSPPSPSLAPSLSSHPKLARFVEERDALLASSSFYELLQLYKAQIHRHSARKDPATASLLALDGASTLLSRQQGNAGGELALILIDTYTRQQLTPSPLILSTLLGLFWAFPVDARTSRLSFIKAAVKWSIGPTRKQGHPDLHLSLARFYALPPAPTLTLNPPTSTTISPDKDYANSHLHYLLAASASTPLALAHGAHVPPTLTPTPSPHPPLPPHRRGVGHVLRARLPAHRVVHPRLPLRAAPLHHPLRPAVPGPG